MNLAGQTAIVTGGAIRLGKAFAFALGHAGARIVLHYGQSETAANETLSELTSRGIEAIAVQADLNQPVDACEKLFSEVEREFGPAQVLINCAAIFDPAPFTETDEPLFDATFNINFKAPFFLSQWFATQLPESLPGQIVNIIDWRAEKIDSNFLAYSLAKNSLLQLTKSLAVELAPRIRVNAIAPGAILPPPDQPQAYLERKAEKIPLKRTGTPEDLVAALSYLLNSEFVTGEVLHVTGGEHL